MVRLALVSYLAPPNPAVASHRVLRLTRALLARGHEVHWVTQEEGRLLVKDPTLAELIPPAVRIHGLGGPTIYSRPVAATIGAKVLRTLVQKLPRWLALPDSHLEWAWRLHRRLPELLAREKAEVALICCGPHSQILALAALRRRLPGLRIVVDYRDLLSGNAWNAPPRARTRQSLLARERRLLARADHLFLNTSEALECFARVVGDLPGLTVQVMRNAADYELAREVVRRHDRVELGPGVHLGFFGTIYPRRRLLPLLVALAGLPPELQRQITLHCYCDQLDSARHLDEDLAAVGAALTATVVREGMVTFGRCLRAMEAMDALVLVNGPEAEDGIFVPGKLFDYLMVGRPVLFLGREGDAWRIVASTSGPEWCFRYGEGTRLAEKLASLFGGRPAGVPPSAEQAPATVFAPLLELLGEMGERRS